MHGIERYVATVGFIGAGPDANVLLELGCSLLVAFSVSTY